MTYSTAELLALSDVIDLTIAEGSPHAFAWNPVTVPDPRGWFFTHIADADALQAEVDWLAQNPDGCVMPDLKF